MRAATAAYVAGLLDGDGAIQAKQIMRRRRAYWCISVNISSCIPRYLRDLRREVVLGKLTAWQPKDGRRIAARWSFHGDHALRLLKALLPHLRLKKRQAAAAIRFLTASKKRKTRTMSTPLIKARANAVACIIRGNDKTRKQARPTKKRGIR